MSKFKDQLSRLMKHKLTLPITIAVVVLLVLVTLLLNSYQKNRETSRTNITISPSPDATLGGQISPDADSTLVMEPNSVKIDRQGNGKVDFIITTGKNEVTAVQIELTYDPQAITNVSITPGSFFAKPTELLKRIDKVNGRVTYMLGINPTQQPLKGKGVAAELTFSKTPGTKVKQTELAYGRTSSSETIIAATGVDLSVLRDKKSAIIILTQ